MSENLLTIENLHVRYNSGGEVVRAVNGVSLSIGRRETLGLVGETGAGKTTTALSIMRLLPERIGEITQGRITLDGESLLDQKDAHMRSIRGAKAAMIFQDPMTSLNPVITVGDQIYEALSLHNSEGKPKEALHARVDEMLELVGIPAQRKNSYPHEFSGGMKQRVVIAMALACSPALLIADEPTTALDVTIQAQVLSMISELKERFGTSMLLITHDLGVVAQTCDNVAIMYAGEIIEYGTVEEIFLGDRHHPYTEGLFGSIPDIHSTAPRLKPIVGLMPDPTDLPEGCKFHPRCPRCTEACRTRVPPVFQDGSHRIRCHLYGEEGEP